ncbi:carbonic anhydrase 13-like [Haliotis rufescens]|uniref:carbonic anhydrase 13-like n=1 Tax=Haliotis rufescens TaxID=6454 RepID=UPI001EAFBF2C|nr:carbonic anhydrase 13-like [Haliotis rufescens]
MMQNGNVICHDAYPICQGCFSPPLNSLQAVECSSCCVSFQMETLSVLFVIFLRPSHGFTSYRSSYTYNAEPRLRLCTAGSVSKSSFGYNMYASNGPLRWHRISTCCGGAKQSPVPLSTRGAACGQPYTLTYSQSQAASVSSVTYNNGQTATMTFPKRRLSLSDVPRRQGCTFLLGEIHYHAGITGDTGSEHWLEHTGYGAEVHLVHYNRKYSGIVEATSKPDGLAVIAILIQKARTSPNSELRRYVRLVSRLKANDAKLRTTIRPLLLLPHSKEFFIYEGSLTSPPCSESVLWVVMRQPLQLSSRGLQMLRNLPRKGGRVLATYTNVRPEQELNNRLVETNFPCSDNLDAFNTPNI